MYGVVFAAERMCDDTAAMLVDEFGISAENAGKVIELIPADLPPADRLNRACDLWALLYVLKANDMQEDLRAGLTF